MFKFWSIFSLFLTIFKDPLPTRDYETKSQLKRSVSASLSNLFREDNPVFEEKDTTFSAENVVFECETPMMVRRKSIDVSKIDMDNIEEEPVLGGLLMPSIKISCYNSTTKLNSSVFSLNSCDI